MAVLVGLITSNGIGLLLIAILLENYFKAKTTSTSNLNFIFLKSTS
jgi:hypothetical protein